MRLAGERALVTGATGFLGSRLVRLLLREGARVRAYVRASSDRSRLAGLSCEEAVGSLDDPAALRRAIEGCRAVFHLAACTSLLERDREAREEANVRAVGALLGVLEAFPGTRLVHCSSVGAVAFSGRPETLDESGLFDARGVHYFETKRRGEELVLAAVSRGRDAVIVNPGTLIGPGMKGFQRKAFASAASGRSLAYPPGGNCFTAVDDAARGLLRAFEKGRSGERYILGGANLSFRDYLSALARAGGSRPPLFPLPGALLPAAGWVLERTCGIMGADTGRLAAGFGYYSSAKAVRELGYEITPLDDTIREALSEMRP